VQFNSLNELDKSMSLSILSYNTNSFKYDGESRALEVEGESKIADFVNNINPDMICFQEFSAIKYKAFKNYLYWFKTNIVLADKSVMAMFSKYPIVNKGYINFPDSRNQAIYADVRFNNKIIRVYNIHLESYKLASGNSYVNADGIFRLRSRVEKAQRMQKQQAQIIIDHANVFKGEVVFVGDFNTTQFSKTYKYLKENKKDSFIEAGIGFGGTYPRFNYPFRIDFALVDKKIEVSSHKNFKIHLSDHEPILVNLVID
jgi:endonuclease/exonuclease/phosphatase family metal-dependent hydrolase